MTIMREAQEKMKAILNMDVLDQETIREVERMGTVRVSTKHINLWMRQLEVKRKEIRELAGLLKLDAIKDEIEKEKSLESWAKTTTNHFTKKAERMLFEENDNFVWSGKEGDITCWC